MIAIGYPLNQSGPPTVTRGIISAHKYDVSQSRWEIQHDASINPGNSGGPLFTTSGELLGINTERFELFAERPVEGVAFAISIFTVQAYLDEISRPSGG